MECVEGALKSSFRKDMAVKLTPQTFLEELSAFNVQNVASCDDFFVDELLDFSHEEEEGLFEEEQEPEQQNHASPQHEKNQNQSHEFSYPEFNDHFSVPADDAADLEWLSHFVEDSFSEYSISFPTLTLTDNLATKAPEPEKKRVPAQPCFKTPVPAKARSKRNRTGVRVWPLMSPSFNDSSSSSSLSSSSSSSTPSSSSSSSPSPSSPLVICTANIEPACLEMKKVKRRVVHDGSSRRCSHCGVQKTPQWRTGPLGAKTLCNACGVRYKSGRLLPEYRPACSPTFSSELHSNHHRKVLEMRRKKEVTVEPVTGLASPTVVSGF